MARYLEGVLPLSYAGESNSNGRDAYGIDNQDLALSPIVARGGASLVAADAVVTAMAARSACDAVLSPLPLDAISAVPLDRWDVEAQAVGALPARFGAFLSSVDLFDVALFGLSSGEAELMDAQQRLLLELSLEVRAATLP